jgi:hypothetical protein
MRTVRVRSAWLAAGLGVSAVVAAWLGAACSPAAPPAETLGGNTPVPTTDGATDSPPVGRADAGTGDGAAADAGGDALADVRAGPADAAPVDGPSRDGGSSDGGAGEGGPRDGALADAPGASSEGGPVGPLCDPSQTWAPVMPIASVPDDAFARFGGIGVDELTIAWISAAGAIYTADRTTRGNDFGVPIAIDTTTTPVAVDRVALSAAGFAVVAVSADRTKIVGFDRMGLFAPWSPASPLQFQNVNAMASSEQSTAFSEPVLGGDGASLYFVLTSAGSSPVLFESRWDVASGEWTTGVALPNADFASGLASATYATGASSDGLTLFFRDATGVERAAWRDAVTSPFTRFADMSAVPEAAPNFLCTTLYFQGGVDAGVAGAFIAQ